MAGVVCFRVGLIDLSPVVPLIMDNVIPPGVLPSAAPEVWMSALMEAQNVTRTIIAPSFGNPNVTTTSTLWTIDTRQWMETTYYLATKLECLARI